MERRDRYLTAQVRRTIQHRELVTGVVGARLTVSTAPFGRTMWLTRDAGQGFGQGFAFAPSK
jgi:hypothetical protein